MSVIEEQGQRAIAATMEMWNAMLEIYSRKLWRARFDRVGDWLDHISELGYTGMSRSNVFNKLSTMNGLMKEGVRREIAAAAVTSVPGAVSILRNSAEFRSAVRDQDPNEYIHELALLAPGEAIAKVRTDKGNRVEMWLREVRHGAQPGTVIAVVVRSDGQRGYTAYDVKVTIEPQIPGNRDLVGPVTDWLTDKIGGHHDKARLK